MDEQQPLVPWISGNFDGGNLTLVRNAFNLLRCGQHRASVMACGHFLGEGLKRGERVAMATFDHPDHIIGLLDAHGFSFLEALQEERFLYLYYKSTVVRAMRLTADYQNLFDELLRLCNGPVGRVAFLNVEVLMNLQTLPLAQTSVAELAVAAARSGATVLGVRTPVPGIAGEYLDAACNSLVPLILELTRTNPSEEKYMLHWLKAPTQAADGEVQMALRVGEGYVDTTCNIAATA